MAIVTFRQGMIGILCLISASPCVAQKIAQPKPGVDNATYVIIELPSPVGTFPTSINDSMTVSGYYLNTYTQARGFVRDADGNITTFSVLNSDWTEPLSINAAGEVTGFFETEAGIPRGFVRKPDGHVATFDLAAFGSTSGQTIPIDINDYGVVAGNIIAGPGSAGFRRTPEGAVTTLSDSPLASPTVITGLNDGGTVVGYGGPGGVYLHSFYAQPDGFLGKFDVPMKTVPGYQVAAQGTAAESVNGLGEIAGFYTARYQCVVACGSKPVYGAIGAFVRSPDGAIVSFNTPGQMVISSRVVLPEDEEQFGSMPGGISINQQGAVTASFWGDYGIWGFIRDPYGLITPFEPIYDAIQTAPTSINSAGVIAGSVLIAWDSDSTRSLGFLRIPAP